MSSRPLDSRPAGALPLFWMTIVAAGTAIAAVRLSEMGVRYVTYGVLALAFGTTLVIVPNKRRLLLIVLFLASQLHAAVFFSYVGGPRSAGWSGPPGIMFPVGFLPVPVLLMIAWGTAGNDPENRWDWGGKMGRAALAVVATTCVSVLVSPERFLTACYSLQVMQLWLVMLAVLNGVREPSDRTMVLRMLGITIMVQSLVYFLESALGLTFVPSGELSEASAGPGRHGGTVGTNPASFSSFMLPPVLIYVAKLVGSPPSARRTGDYIITSLGLLSIALTYTRASWGALAIGSAAIIARGVQLGLLNRRAVLGLILLAGVAGVIAYPTMALRLQNNLHDRNERWALMVMAWQVIKAHPILGIGGGAYSFVFADYLSGGLTKGWLFVVHNAYLLSWAETGLLGLLALVVFLGSALYGAWRLSESDDRDAALLGLGWLGGVVALAFQMWWDVWRLYEYNAMLWAMVGLSGAALRISSLANAEVKGVASGQ